MSRSFSQKPFLIFAIRRVLEDLLKLLVTTNVTLRLSSVLYHRIYMKLKKMWRLVSRVRFHYVPECVEIGASEGRLNTVVVRN